MFRRFGFQTFTAGFAAFVFLGAVTVGPVWSQEADEGSAQGAFKLQEGEAFVGLDLSPDGQELIMTSAHPGHGRAVFARADTLEVTGRIETPPGLRLADPRYSPDGTEILFAGTCRPENSPCLPEQEGWNIYRYDIAAQSLHQLTEPMVEFARRKPAWGPEGSAYFVGYNNRSAGASVIASAAIYEVRANGESVPVFPSDSYEPLSNSIQAPIGNFYGISILSVDPEGITFAAQYNVDLTRPNNPEGDRRVIEFADSHFYAIPRDQWRDSSTYWTIFRVTADELFILLDSDRFTGEVPNKEHLSNVASDGDTIWVLRKGAPIIGYWHKVSKISGSHAELIDAVETPFKYGFSDFEVSGRLAILVANRYDESPLLFRVEDWETFEAFDLKP